jgi:peroxiredoxin (alkyl hydroperoxide reductase subunit C)
MSKRWVLVGLVVLTMLLVRLPALMAEAPEVMHIPLIGDDAPAFTADTTQGKITFPDDFKGKWVVFFSHPGDFTPVCTTEFITFGKMTSEFEALNCQLIGLSVDSKYSHIAWMREIKEKVKFNGMENIEIKFPVIADSDMAVAKKYGMIQPNADGTKTVRAVFVIDPAAKIRAVIYYPLTTGRNMQEIKRLVIALETHDAQKMATPADWQPGDDMIVPLPPSYNQVQERVDKAGESYYCVDWFLCFKKLAKEAVDAQFMAPKK